MGQIFIALLALGLFLTRDSVLAHPGSGVASNGSVTTIATVVR